MTNERKLTWVAGLFSLLMILLAIFIPRVDAQSEAALSALTPTIALARTGVREAGMRAHQRDDISAIHAVVSFLATHIYRSDYLTAVLRATNSAPVRSGGPRPWITQLTPNLTRPPLWPGHLRWTGRGDRHWRLTLRHSRDVRLGDVEHRCRLPAIDDGEDQYLVPHAWGSAQDSVVFRRRHPEALELDCGQTCRLRPDGSVATTRDGLPSCNRWFHFPRYEQRFGEP